MAEILIRQGEDLKVKVDLLDGTTPVSLVPAEINNIVSVMYVGTTEVAKYSLNPLSGHETLDYHPSQSNSIELFVKRSQSKTFPIGAIKVSTVVKFIDADFPEGRHEEYVSMLGRCIAGSAKDLEV